MPERGTLSVHKAGDLIGYAPEFPVERAVPQYVEWYRRLAKAHPDLLPA